MRFENKTIIVTGAGGGIGRASALRARVRGRARRLYGHRRLARDNCPIYQRERHGRREFRGL